MYETAYLGRQYFSFAAMFLQSLANFVEMLPADHEILVFPMEEKGHPCLCYVQQVTALLKIEYYF